MRKKIICAISFILAGAAAMVIGQVPSPQTIPTGQRSRGGGQQPVGWRFQLFYWD